MTEGGLSLLKRFAVLFELQVVCTGPGVEEGCPRGVSTVLLECIRSMLLIDLLAQEEGPSIDVCQLQTVNLLLPLCARSGAVQTFALFGAVHLFGRERVRTRL